MAVSTRAFRAFPTPRGGRGRGHVGLKSMALLLTSALWLAGQAVCAEVPITLSTTTSPASGSPGVTVNLVGFGFPSGSIPPSSVTVTLESPAGTETIAAAIQVTTIIGPVRRVTFEIPRALGLAATTTYTVSIGGSTSTGTAFASENTASLTVFPSASIASVSPSTGQQGQTVTVTITGTNTNFVDGESEADFGAGVSVGGAPPGTFGPIDLTSATSATATLVISAGAALGSQTVTVVTDGQYASLQNGFTIEPGASPVKVAELTNIVSLTQFSAVDQPPAGHGSQDVCVSLNSGVPGANCFTIQQNFFVVTPGNTHAGNLYTPGLGPPQGRQFLTEFTYWAQNGIVVFSAQGQVFIEQFVQVWNNPNDSTAVLSPPRSLKNVSSPTPSVINLTSELSGGVLTFTASWNNYSFSYSANESSLSSLNSGSYIGVPAQAPDTESDNGTCGTPGDRGTPGPPELALVGGGGGSTASFSSTTGSVSSQIGLSQCSTLGGCTAGSNTPEIQEELVGGVFRGSETGEGSVHLTWPSLDAGWSLGGSVSFQTQSTAQYYASGIWFQPVPGGTGGPVIQSVTPVPAQANQSQGVTITGSGFGDTPPSTDPLADGSVDTQVCDTSSEVLVLSTPALAIHDNGAGPDAWDAGQFTCSGGPDTIGVYGIDANNWSHSTITLTGFGSQLGNASSPARYNIAPGDTLTFEVLGPNNSGIATFNVQASPPVSNVGPITYSSNTTLASDLYCTNLTINPDVTLTTNGFNIFCSGTVTNNGTIKTGLASNGGVGANESPAGASNGGNFPGSLGGSGGGGGGSSAITLGPAQIAGSGGATVASGGSGGAEVGGSCGTGGAGTSGSTPTAPAITNALIQTWNSQDLSTFLAGGGGGGGAGSGYDCTDTGGSNGGSGASGIYIQANAIVAGTIVAPGQDGGSSSSAGGGGGGGGAVVLSYGGGGLTDGTYNTAGGTGGAPGPNGGAGGNGGNGRIVKFNYGTAPPVPYR
jgi:hypothetical protein